MYNVLYNIAFNTIYIHTSICNLSTGETFPVNLYLYFLYRTHETMGTIYKFIDKLMI